MVGPTSPSHVTCKHYEAFHADKNRSNLIFELRCIVDKDHTVTEGGVSAEQEAVRAGLVTHYPSCKRWCFPPGSFSVIAVWLTANDAASRWLDSRQRLLEPREGPEGE